MNEMNAKETVSKRRTGRSPAYPFISVERALEQASALFTVEGEYEAPLPSAFKAWGYGEKSSGGRQTLATLRYYGLIDVSGEGDARKVKVSELARRIILDQREDKSEKKKLIRQVALAPAAHKILFEHYPNGLGSDGSVHHFLVFEHGFKPDAATDLLEEFKETARFAELYEPQKPVDKVGEEEDTNGDEENAPSFKVGDFVHWESGGQLQWKDPWKVTAVETHEDGEKYLQVEGSGTDAGQKGWIPMTEAIEGQEASPAAGKIFTPPPSSRDAGGPQSVLGEGWQEERLIDDGGDEIFIQYEGDPTIERYEFIRDYLDFKIDRLRKKESKADKLTG